MRLRASIGLVALWVGVAVAAPPAKPPVKPRVPTQAQVQELVKLSQQMSALVAKQAYLAASKISKQILELDIKMYGAGSPMAEGAEAAYAGMLAAGGDYEGAHQIYVRRLAAAEAAHGPESREVLQALPLVEGFLMMQGRYDELEPYKQRELALTKKLDGETSREYAGALFQYGSILGQRGEIASSLRTYDQALAIYDATPQSGYDYALTGLLLTVGFQYLQADDLAKATADFNRLLRIAKTGSVDQYAPEEWSIASAYTSYGHPELGKPLFADAIDAYMKEIRRIEQANADDPKLPVMWGMLSLAYRNAGDLATSEQYIRKADARAEKAGGPAATTWVPSLASLLTAEGKYDEAIALLERADKLLPANAVLRYDNPLEIALRGGGHYDRALQAATRYRDQLAKFYGYHGVTVGLAELDMAAAQVLLGDEPHAAKTLGSALDLEEHHLANALAIGTESDHEEVFKNDTYFYEFAMSFDRAFPAKAEPARLAMLAALRRKGRVLDASAASMAALRSKLSPEDKQLLDDLASARAQLAKLTVAATSAVGPDYAKTVADLEEKIEKLEIQLGQKSAQYKAASQPITIAAIQKLVPRGARLVEIVNFQPYDFRKLGATNPSEGPRRYAAYVLGQTGDPVHVDLGDAPAIDDAVKAFRKSVSNPNSTDVAEKGHALYALTIGKLEKALGGVTEILMAPDGSLNLVPFAALTDDSGKLLVERENFTYLTSGRDLLRLTVKTKAQGGGVVFANPAFDATGGPGSGSGNGTRGVRAMDLGALEWPQLPGTGQEADLVERTWGHLADYRGDRATEGALKALHGPKILHLATHGFFLPDKRAASASAVGPAAPMLAMAAPPSGQNNPLLRSGLALAGANKLKSGNDDGILTALEASGLDLWGTELVVLSACDTGNGKVTNGDGVFGLRRALVIAGAQSLVMSLWQVDDAATRDLMAGYYAKLKAGVGRSTALRDVQLALHKNPKYAHPFYWAAFLAAGANSPLD